MAQWIRIHLPMQGTPCWFLVQEDSTCHRATKAVSHKHWAHSRNYRACVPQLLTPACPEKAMATHSSVLAWRIPGSAEPGGLPSMGSHSRTRLKRLSSSSMPGTYAPQQEKPPQWEAHVCNKEQPVLTITGENPRKSSEDLAQPPNLNINKNF